MIAATGTMTVHLIGIYILKVFSFGFSRVEGIGIGEVARLASKGKEASSEAS